MQQLFQPQGRTALVTGGSEVWQMIAQGFLEKRRQSDYFAAPKGRMARRPPASLSQYAGSCDCGHADCPPEERRPKHSTLTCRPIPSHLDIRRQINAGTSWVQR